MKTTQQIWDEVQMHNPVFNDEKFDWAINYGVKVMKIRDTDKLNFANTRIGGDFYAPLTTMQKNYIYTFGFAIGARLIGIETLMKQVERANRLIRNNAAKESVAAKYKSVRTELLNSIHAYATEIKVLANLRPEGESAKNLLEQILER
jgi:hypothetical protein